MATKIKGSNISNTFDYTGGAAVNIATAAGNITLDAQGSDTDIIFKGTDNTTDITALTLDMSDNGKAIFKNNIQVGGAHKIDFTGSTTTIAATNNPLTLNSVNRTVQIQFNGSTKIATTSTGATVTGDLTTTADIELGHASDTTIARASAGVVTIEGNTIITTANSDTPSTTTSSSDADHVLVDDGGVLKKITPSNLGIGGGGGSAADDISAGDAAVNITTTSGNITIDAQETNTDIIFKGTTDRYPGHTSAADQVFLTLDGQEYGALKLGPLTPIIFPSSNSGRLYLGGTGSGTQVFKSGTVTYFTALSGDIRINTAFNHRHVECKDGDRTGIFYDDNEKLRTTSTGVYVTGGVRVGGNNAANELDDYEEGTWTATVTASTPPSSAQTMSGKYTKVGRLVHFHASATSGLNMSGASGQLKITGLPFSIVDSFYSLCHFAHNNIGTHAGGSARPQAVGILSGNTEIPIYVIGSGNSWNDFGVDASRSNAGVFVSGTYETDA